VYSLNNFTVTLSRDLSLRMWTSERLSGSRGGSRMSEPVRLKDARPLRLQGDVHVGGAPAPLRALRATAPRRETFLKFFTLLSALQLRGVSKQKIMIIIKPNFIHVKVIFLDGQFMYNCFNLVVLKCKTWNW
jgi:hypothetical protein